MPFDIHAPTPIRAIISPVRLPDVTLIEDVKKQLTEIAPTVRERLENYRPFFGRAA